MTDESPVAGRGLFGPDTEYDTLRLDIRREEALSPRTIHSYLNGQVTGVMNWSHREHFPLMDRRVEAGEVTVEYNTPIGILEADAVPEWLHPYVELRNPFRRQVSTPQTLVEQRREMVTEWAKANTTFGLMALALVTGKASATSDTLTNRRRNVGQIWWSFVLHTLAAAQHDPWLEHHDIWQAIERNIALDGYTFIRSASANAWNDVAGYFEAYSRIYGAHATYPMTTTPVHVRLVNERPPVQETLQAGAREARRIVYGEA